MLHNITTKDYVGDKVNNNKKIANKQFEKQTPSGATLNAQTTAPL